MEDDKEIFYNIRYQFTTTCNKSLFTLPGYNDFASPNININDSKKLKNLSKIFKFKKDLENKVKDLLQNSEIKDRKN